MRAIPIGVSNVCMVICVGYAVAHGQWLAAMVFAMLAFAVTAWLVSEWESDDA